MPQKHPAARDPSLFRTSSSLPLGSDSQAAPFTASSTHSPVVSTAEEVGTTPTVPLHVSRPSASAVVVSTSVVDVVSAGDNSHPSLPVACTDAAAPASAVVADARAASALSKTLSTVIAVVDHALSHAHSVSFGTARFTPGNNTSARPSALEYHRRLPDADKLAVRSDQAHQRALRSRKRSALGIAAATTRAPASSNSALPSAAPQASTATPPLNSVSALMEAKVGPAPPVDSSLSSSVRPRMQTMASSAGGGDASSAPSPDTRRQPSPAPTARHPLFASIPADIWDSMDPAAQQAIVAAVPDIISASNAIRRQAFLNGLELQREEATAQAQKHAAAAAAARRASAAAKDDVAKLQQQLADAQQRTSVLKARSVAAHATANSSAAARDDVLLRTAQEQQAFASNHRAMFSGHVPASTGALAGRNSPSASVDTRVVAPDLPIPSATEPELLAAYQETFGRSPSASLATAGPQISAPAGHFVGNDTAPAGQQPFAPPAPPAVPHGFSQDGQRSFAPTAGPRDHLQGASAAPPSLPLHPGVGHEHTRLQPASRGQGFAPPLPGFSKSQGFEHNQKQPQRERKLLRRRQAPTTSPAAPAFAVALPTERSSIRQLGKPAYADVARGRHDPSQQPGDDVWMDLPLRRLTSLPSGVAPALCTDVLTGASFLWGGLGPLSESVTVAELVDQAAHDSRSGQPLSERGQRIFKLQADLRTVYANLPANVSALDVSWGEPQPLRVPQGASASFAKQHGDFQAGWTKVSGSRRTKPTPPPSDGSASQTSDASHRRRRGQRAGQRRDRNRDRALDSSSHTGRAKRQSSRQRNHSPRSSHGGSDGSAYSAPTVSSPRNKRRGRKKGSRNSSDGQHSAPSSRNSSPVRQVNSAAPRRKDTASSAAGAPSKPPPASPPPVARGENASSSDSDSRRRGRRRSRRVDLNPTSSSNSREASPAASTGQAEHHEEVEDITDQYGPQSLQDDDVLSRQVTPPLAHVAAADSQRLLTHNSVSQPHNGLPLSSNTARARHEAIVSAQAISDATRVREVQSKYFTYKFKDLNIHPSLPWPASLSNAVPQFIDSVKRTHTDILQQVDPFSDASDSSTWVRGWDKPLFKAIHKAIKPNQNTTGELIASFHDMFKQVNQRLDDGMSNGEAFRLLLSLIATHFNYVESGDIMQKLSAFYVENGTPFSDFLRRYRAQVNQLTYFQTAWNLGDSWIVLATRNKINEQYSVLMSECFPGARRTAEMPYSSLDEMWKVLNTLSTSKVKAENAPPAKVPSMAGLSLLPGVASYASVSQPHSQTSSRAHSSRQHKQGSEVSPIIQDVFCVSYSEWPLATDEHWETVFTVAQQFAESKSLPPLWSPLVASRAARAAAFDANRGLCLNCHISGHSVRHCREPFLNKSGILNPDLAWHEDGKTFKSWQQRMRSHRNRLSVSQPHQTPYNTSGGQGGYANHRRSRGRGRSNQQQAAPTASSHNALTYQPQHTAPAQATGQALVPAQNPQYNSSGGARHN